MGVTFQEPVRWCIFMGVVITKKCLGGILKSTWFNTEGATWASQSMVWEWECLFSENKKNTGYSRSLL